MKAPDFQYLRVDSLTDALGALAQFGDQAMVLAGGQSLMALHNLRLAQAGVLVDINRVPGLDLIQDGGGHLAIGCMTRFAALESSALIRRHAPLIAQAVPHVAHHAVRNRGTAGGSMALADPAAELPACCMALGAKVVIVSRARTREVGCEDFITGLYETALEADELLLEIRLPKAPPGAIHRFAEVARRRGDFAQAGVALCAEVHEARMCRVRVALFGVADRTRLATTVMQVLEGARACDVDQAELRAAVDADADPLEDPACPPAYRRHAVAVLLERILSEVATRA